MKTDVMSMMLVLGLVTILSGCKSEEEINEQMKNPIVTELGVFDGCLVKYVDRHYDDKSFFTARCGDTVTTTSNYTEKSGKATVAKRSVTINVPESETELAKQRELLDKKIKAIQKLTPEEQEILFGSKK